MFVTVYVDSDDSYSQVPSMEDSILGTVWLPGKVSLLLAEFRSRYRTVELSTPLALCLHCYPS